jgi:hypothetical protein
MSPLPLATIIIDNYNYGRFLAEAIDSALNQDYPQTEVIVVDDGSTDDSRQVIASYGDRIVPVLQENRGQAAAFNAGFRRSKGGVVVFLDADDSLFAKAITRAVEALRDKQIIKAHWPLEIVDEAGKRTGKTCPRELAEGDLRDKILEGGPWCVPAPPTTCNAWTRRILERIMPVPEKDYRICADAYLVALGWVCGPTRRISEPQGCYRSHGGSNYRALPLSQKLRRDMELYERLCGVLGEHFSRQGLACDPEIWKRRPWAPHQVYQASQDLAGVIPAGTTFVLVDGENWGGPLCPELRQLPFLERNGQYWGPPADDDNALHEFERMRNEFGAGFIAFAEPAFWWLDHYIKFAGHLRRHFRCTLRNERLVIFDLRTRLP